MLHRIAFLLLLLLPASLSVAATAALNNETLLATVDLRPAGNSVNATPAFTNALETALVRSADWLGLEDLRLSPEKTVEENCLVYPLPCQRVTLHYEVLAPVGPSLSSPPMTKAEFSQLIDGINNGPVAISLKKLGAPVNRLNMVALRVNDAAFAAGNRSSLAPPRTAADGSGPFTVRFQLKIIGREARLGNSEMLRALVVGITSELAAAGNVSFSGIRVVDLVRSNAAPTPVAAGPRRSLLRLRRRHLLDALGNYSLADATFEVARVPSASEVRRLFNEIRLLSETNGLTTILTSKGFQIDSCVFGGYQTPNWFTVNGRAFADGNSLIDRATLGEPAPLALTIALPLLAAAAALGGCLWWSWRQRRRGRDFWGRKTGVESLAAAVVAARKGDAAAAYAMLLDPIKGPKGKGEGKGGGGGAAAKGTARDFDWLASDWKLDPSTIEIARDKKSGAHVVLGAGASSIVYRGTLNGVQDVAVKLFTRPLEDALMAAADRDRAADESARGSTSGRGGGGGDMGGGRTSRHALGNGLPWLPRLGRRWRSGSSNDTAAAASGSARKLPPEECPPPSSSTVAATELADDELAADCGGLKPPPPPSSQRSSPPRRAAARQLEELAREVTIMRAMRDKNLVSFIGVCLFDGHPAIVSELMTNGNLYRALANDAGLGGGRRFGWTRAFDAAGRPMPNSGLSRRVALDVARGLTYLHSRGVVHLDLKSANVLLSRSWEAKVADYGVSRVLKCVGGGNNAHVSTLHSAVGTLAWCAPEVLLGRPVDEKADLYSFGVLLWELSSGEPPNGRRLRALEVPAEAPQVVADTISSCLSEDPGARPTAADLVALFKNMGMGG